MTVREVLPEESDAASLVQTIAFLGASDPDEPPSPTDVSPRRWASFTDDGKLAACLDVIDYTMMFDGHPVKMAGIGSVATLPEHRRSGHVREIFKQALAASRDEGVLFSCLYPFSHGFYRQFGYELCATRVGAVFPTERVNRLAPHGHLEHFQKGGDIAEFLAIHRAFSQGFNMAVVQEEPALRRELESYSDNARRYVYLWRDDDGHAKSFLSFSTEGQDGAWVMAIRRLEWVDAAGFQGMVAALGKFANPYEKCRWQAPPGVDCTALVDEPWKVERTLTCGGMNRVVDAGAALQLLRPPAGDGGVVIAVSDDFLEWNNASYAIEWSGGALGVAPTNRRPDATMPVTTLVQLMCGFVTPATARLSASIAIDGHEAELARLFPLKPVYITERF